ncbi:MAG TPA: hypothetical protein VLA92_05060 [Candidatus Saccharimonadales bacterium]|nr:hypothetical protein [Candidatus Saccharimonadales bacterium]
MANEFTPGINPDSYERSPNPGIGSAAKRRSRFAGKWMHPEWSRNWAKRRREKLQQDAQESRSGVHTFLTMANLAIRMAVDTEPNKKIRNVKRRELQARWRQYQRDLLGITRA